MKTLDNILSVYVTLPYFDLTPDAMREAGHSNMPMSNGNTTSMPMILSAIEATYAIGHKDGFEAGKKRNKVRAWAFTVTGKGPFPFDMLRHDCCWPVDGVHLLANEQRREERTIELSTTLRNGPTIDRWRSFGWTVSDLLGDPD